MSTRILLAAPVRDRAWILPAYLERLTDLEVPEGVQLDAYFLVNGDEGDGGVEILKRFAAVMEGRMRVVVERFMAPPPVPPTRETHNRMGIFNYLAALRNTTLDRALEHGYDYLFSVDSDILIPAWTLKRLLAADKDVVAAALVNDEFWNLPPGYRAYNMLRRADFPGPDGQPAYLHVANMPAAGLIEVDVTGACYLVARRVLEARCRFGNHASGEDVPFCQEVQAAGFHLYGDAGLVVDHIMGQHTFIAPQVRAEAMSPRSPYIVRLMSGDRPRFDVLYGPQATRNAMSRIWARLLIEDLRNEPGSPIPAACEVADFHWDQAAGLIRMRLTEADPPAAKPEAQPAPASAAPAGAARGAPRRGVAAGAGRR